MTLRISVVIPTYRRLPLLQRVLTALLAQTLDAHDFEIVVVDDGSEDAVHAAVQAIASARAAPVLRYVRPTQRGGPAAARNLGWRAARGTLIAVTPDHTIPAPDWLEAGVRAMDAHPRWSAAAGRVHVPRETSGTPPTDHERMTRGLEAAEFVTANAFVRRDALVRIDGFDERFERAWREDSDLQFRLERRVGPVGRIADAVVEHPVRSERWGISLRQQRNTYFDALLYKKHPRAYRQRIRRVPPWDYYAIVAATLAAPVLGPGSLVLAVALILRLAAKRLAGADHSRRHMGEMLATSALIPFLSVYWRLRGAVHFRVPFV